MICAMRAARACPRAELRRGPSLHLAIKSCEESKPRRSGSPWWTAAAHQFFPFRKSRESLGYGMLTRFSVPAARILRGAVVFFISCGINAVSHYGAQAETRFHCPGGQIYRVSKHVCAPKESAPGQATAVSAAARREVMGPPMPPSLAHPSSPSPSAPAPPSAPQISSVERPSAATEKPPAAKAISPPIQQQEPATPQADSEMSTITRTTEGQSETAKLEKLVAAYREALKDFIRGRAPLDWAVTRSDLGNALAALGEREGRTATLEEAVAIYREALNEFTRESAPLQWAAIENNLGDALATIGKEGSGTLRLEEAVVAYREALKERTRERAPLDWAMTQSGLGNALALLGVREGRTATLEDAVVIYREALKEFTRDRAPLQWATIQNNLGAVLATIGEEGSGTLSLEEAVAAYHEALIERTRERAPLDWGISTGNQGVALMLLAERLHNPEMAKTALGQIDVAFEAMGDADHASFAAYYEAQLRKARALVGRLSQR